MTLTFKDALWKDTNSSGIIPETIHDSLKTSTKLIEFNERDCLWKPSIESLQSCSLEKFRKYVNSTYNKDLKTYKELYEWSIHSINDFWSAIWAYCGIVYTKFYENITDLTMMIDSIPEWFHGSRLNFAENLLYGVKDLDETKLALIAILEGEKKVRSMSFRELRDQVRLVAIALKSFGIKQGDRVAGYMSNGLECVVAMLATSSLGAVWTVTSPDFGVHAVIERFQQIRPRILFCVNATVYNRKTHSTWEKLHSIVHQLSPKLEQIIMVPFINSHPCKLEDLPNRYVS